MKIGDKSSMSNNTTNPSEWMEEFNKAKSKFKKEWLENNPFPKRKLLLDGKSISCFYDQTAEDFIFVIVKNSYRTVISVEEMFKIIDWINDAKDESLKLEEEPPWENEENK